MVGCNSQQTPTKEKPSISQKELYDLQEKCGKSCKEYNKENKYGLYECHYNKKLNKCFSLITILQDKDTYHILYDINENKSYGSCVRTMGEREFLCYFLDNNNVSGKKEWDTLVKPYMEE